MPAELPEPVKAAETRKPEFGIGAEKVFRAHDPKADPVATAGPRGFGAGWAPGPAGGRSGRERARPEPDLRGPTLQSPSVQPDTRSSPYQPGPRGNVSFILLHDRCEPLDALSGCVDLSFRRCDGGDSFPRGDRIPAQLLPGRSVLRAR